VAEVFCLMVFLAVPFKAAFLAAEAFLVACSRKNKCQNGEGLMVNVL
jgi:hypothetical protein